MFLCNTFSQIHSEQPTAVFIYKKKWILSFVKLVGSPKDAPWNLAATDIIFTSENLHALKIFL